MRSLRESNDDDQGSMGPGTDLVVSLLAVLLLILSSLTIDYRDLREIFLEKQKVLDQIAEDQKLIITEIAKQFHTDAQNIKDSTEFEIYTHIDGGNIRVKNSLTTQKISFGSNILFDNGKDILKVQGQHVLLSAGKAIKNHLERVKEIQILGHADITGDENLNLDLAGDRANSVYKFFQKVGISPYDVILSATSYGKFMPVSRSENDIMFTEETLVEANSLPALKARNRRIEVVLRFE